MVSEQEMKEILSQNMDTDVDEFVILTKSKSGDDVDWMYHGSALSIAGLVSWFQYFVNKNGFKNMKE